MAGFSFYQLFKDPVPEVTSSDVGPDTQYPIGLDLDTIFKWYYRVKKWRFDFEYVCNASAIGTDSSASASLPGSATIDTVINPSLSNESYFSVAFPRSEAGEIFDSNEDSDSGATSFSVAQTNYVSGFSSVLLLPNMRRYNDQYYPSVSAGIDLVAQAEVGNLSDFRTVGRGVSTLYSSTFPLSIPWEIDGISFTQTGSYNDYSSGTGSGASVNCEIIKLSLTPIEYWPYNVPVFGNIYDPTTGAQNVDPFSVQSW